MLHVEQTKNEKSEAKPMQQLVDTFFRAVKDKDITSLDTLFTEDAVYVERNGETYNGLPQIRSWFSKLISDGEVRAWDIRRIRDGAVEWYYEYRRDYAGSVSYDGVSIVELSDGKIKRWSNFIQNVKKSYPLENNNEELMETAGAVEYYADWLETMALHDGNEKLQAAAAKLSEALEEIMSAM